MNLKQIFAAALMILAFAPVQARVLADISSVQVEGNTLRARGVRLTSPSNPARAWVTDLDGNNPTVVPVKVNRSNTAIRITMPLVAQDTKMKLFISGGNVPQNSPQEKFIVVINNPSLDTSTTTFDDVPSVVGSGGVGTQGPTGPQGPAGPAGPAGANSFVYGGTRDVNDLPDYDENYEEGQISIPSKNLRNSLQTLLAGEIDIGNSNAVNIFDSDRDTEDILGLIKGSGDVGQRISLIVDDFFFIALSDPFFLREKNMPVVGSITLPRILPIRIFPQGQNSRTIEVDHYQLMPVFPGMVLELIYDGTQWRIINLPFYLGEFFFTD